jgi:hypothetical protein
MKPLDRMKVARKMKMSRNEGIKAPETEIYPAIHQTENLWRIVAEVARSDG